MARTQSAMRATRGCWLRRIRQDRKLTQAQLAKKIGVTTNAISLYENGHINPGLDVLDRMFVVLKIWWVDLHVPLDSSPPPHRDVPRPFLIRSHYINRQAIDEFVRPTRKPEQYPTLMRCWSCHGRPGECQCWEQCKVCGLLFRRGGKCSGILH